MGFSEEHISNIAIHPTNSNIVYLGVFGDVFKATPNRGIYKTTDGGSNWTKSLFVNDSTGSIDLIMDPSNPDVLYAAMWQAWRQPWGMSSGGAHSGIYKTTDGGATWRMQFQNQDPSAFYDCFAFWTPARGIAHSDAVDGRFPVIRTTDGKNWEDIGDNLPPALDGEFSFASSGTCVATQGRHKAWIATGGASPSRVLATRDGGDTWNAYDSPLRGSPSAGVFSVAFRDGWHGIIGGGDLDPAAPLFDQTATSSDGGRTWTITEEQPNVGTVFGVSYAGEVGGGHGHEGDDHGEADANQTVVVTGPGGAAWTPDEGDTWFTLPGVTGYWGVAFGSPKTGWLVGTEGRILRIDFRGSSRD
jgi:photosystem II stability/assembly factor-like uncharacterized protein